MIFSLVRLVEPTYEACQTSGSREAGTFPLRRFDPAPAKWPFRVANGGYFSNNGGNFSTCDALNAIAAHPQLSNGEIDD
jgi:hypothetical protein